MTQTLSTSTYRNEHDAGRVREVLPDVARMKTAMVNLYFISEPASGRWALVDTGLPMYAKSIIAAAEERFGKAARPEAIVLTHGHFDHVGNVKELAEAWDVPVYSHRLELPYLTGRSDYPPPDPTVGGGMMARTAKLFPWSAIDLGDRVRELPADGSVPGAPRWRWIHTPGHAPGHVSLFRDADRALIAGDAFITTKQESLISVITQLQVIHGPPAYFTTDWNMSKNSVRALAELHPSVAATGHGVSMYAPELDEELTWLAENFDHVAVPSDGRYVREPARADENGVTYVPPARFDPAPWIAGGLAVVGAAALLSRQARSRSSTRWPRTLRNARARFS